MIITPFQAGILWATSSQIGVQRILRNDDPFYAKQIRAAQGGTVFRVTHARKGTTLYCLKLKRATREWMDALGWTGRSDAERRMPAVEDPSEFCRAYVQAHCTIDRRRSGTRITPRLRIYASEYLVSDIGRVLLGELGIGVKKPQRCLTDTGATWAIYYQSPREVRAIADWITSGTHSEMLAASIDRVLYAEKDDPLKQELIDRIIREGAVDTDKYRYLYETDNNGARIKRLPIDLLDTTVASGGWDVIKVLEGK